MPQISASINHQVINAISELAVENKPIPASFSTMTNALLSSHPEVLKKIHEMDKRNKPKSKPSPSKP